MNKFQLVEHIASKVSLTKKDVAAVLDAFVEAVQSTVKSGEAVTLTNFGTFTFTERSATVKRNPRTGETVKVPARKVPKFKPGKLFKEMLSK